MTRPLFSMRDLHLYLGLFFSPFVLVFAVSVFFLTHAWLPATGPAEQRKVAEVEVPAGLDRLRGREQVEAIRGILDRLGVTGEIGFVRHIPREKRYSIPVSYPGHETIVDLHAETGRAVISARTTGLADALVQLHKMPGPHNVATRGNSAHIRIWRWLADASVYGTLLITISGVYLWTLLRAERRTGWLLLLAGAGTMGGLILALVG